MLIGLLVMGSSLLIAGPLARVAINTPETELSKKRAYGSIRILVHLRVRQYLDHMLVGPSRPNAPCVSVPDIMCDWFNC